MAEEGLIDHREALLRVDPELVYNMLLPAFDIPARDVVKADGRLLGRGLGASPGAATGADVFSADAAAELGGRGVAVILVRPGISAEDVHGMIRSAGVLTGRGGATSHAAVVERGQGVPCVAGAAGIEINASEGHLRFGGVTVTEGEIISVDGAIEEVFVGTLPTVSPESIDDTELQTLLLWADESRRLEVWANADYPKDAAAALCLGAEGIGLCRTEHMFFEPQRLALVRETILAAHRSGKTLEDGEMDRR